MNAWGAVRSWTMSPALIFAPDAAGVHGKGARGKNPTSAAVRGTNEEKTVVALAIVAAVTHCRANCLYSRCSKGNKEEHQTGRGANQRSLS